MYTWIASYPKSGNTWVRLLISSLVSKNNSDVIDDRLQTKGQCCSRAIFQKFLNNNDPKLNDIDFTKFPSAKKIKEDDNLLFLFQRGEILKKYVADVNGQSSIMLKTHAALNGSFLNQDQFPKGVTKRAILIIRNPLDVLQSAMVHYGRSADDQLEHMLNVSSGTAGDFERTKNFATLQSSWEQFNFSWLGKESENFPLLVLRYEDLLFTPITCVTAINSFLGLGAKENDIVDAIISNRFENLQKLEKTSGFTEKSQHAEKFFNKGKVGSYKHLPDNILRKAVETLGVSAQKFGYVFDEKFNLEIKPMKKLTW